MLPTSDPDRIDIAFDDDRLVDHAGLLLPATLGATWVAWLAGSAFVNWRTPTSTSVTRRGGRTPATNC